MATARAKCNKFRFLYNIVSFGANCCAAAIAVVAVTSAALEIQFLWQKNGCDFSYLNVLAIVIIIIFNMPSVARF